MFSHRLSHSTFILVCQRSIVFHKSTYIHTHTRHEWERLLKRLYIHVAVFVVFLFSLPHTLTPSISICENCNLKCTGTITFGDVQKLNNISWLLFPCDGIHLRHGCQRVHVRVCGLGLATMRVSNCGKPTSLIRFANSKKMKHSKNKW